MSKYESAAKSLDFTGVTVLVLGLLLSIASHSIYPAVVHGEAAEPQRKPQTRRPVTRPAPQRPRVDYSQFSHVTHVTTQKLACDSCHKFPTKNSKEVRKGDAAFPDVAEFPEHSSCLNCHRPQFFARERPAPAICSNCHVAVTPRDTARFLFPSLGDVTDAKLKQRDFAREFGVAFPHDKHLDAIGLNSVPSRDGPAAASGGSLTLNSGRLVPVSFQQKKPAPPKSCPVCHQLYQPQGNSSDEYVSKPPKDLGDAFWLKKGTFQTIPNSHAGCFTCHAADSGLPPEPKNCETCHKLRSPSQVRFDFDAKLAATMGVADKIMLDSWSRRISSGAFRHEAGEHPDLSCLSCHNVESPAFSTVDSKTLKVPVKSCGGADGCHITVTADDGGALNFEIEEKRKNPAYVCTKCHIAFGKEAVPAHHFAAIPAPTKK